MWNTEIETMLPGWLIVSQGFEVDSSAETNIDLEGITRCVRTYPTIDRS